MTIQQTPRAAVETVARRNDIRQRVNAIATHAAQVGRQWSDDPPFSVALACGEVSSPSHWCGEFEVVASGWLRIRCPTQCAAAIREWAMAIVVACDEVMREGDGQDTRKAVT